MKKKIVSLLLAAFMLCTATVASSCEKAGESVSETVAKALEKTAALNSFDAEMEMTMDMSMEGMTMSVPMTVAMKAENVNSEKPVYSATMSTSMLGMNMDVDLYCDGEWVYYSGDGMEYKMPVSEAGEEYDYTGDVDDMIQDIPEELFKDKQFINNDDGSKTVTIDIEEKMFADIYGELIESLNEDSDETVNNVKISDAKVSVTVSGGYISVYDISFKMSMTSYDVETVSDVKACVKYNNPGQEVTVTPMEGYLDFEEYDPYSVFEGLEDFEDFGDLEGLEGFEDLEGFGDFEDYDVFSDLEDLEGLEF